MDIVERGTYARFRYLVFTLFREEYAPFFKALNMYRHMENLYIYIYHQTSEYRIVKIENLCVLNNLHQQ